MLKNKILEKLLAVILIFTLTFANFAFVSKSYAASFAETIFGGKSDTGNKNIEFEAYFETEGDKSNSVISDVNNKDLNISMDLNVKKDGYLKDAKIEITENEEGEELNFALKEKTELEESIRNIEDNTIFLNKIDKASEIKLQIPIEYKNEEFIKEEKVSTDSKVRFSGIYVGNDGNETEVSKEIVLNVSWQDEREVRIEEEATKYVTYGEGIILQTLEKIDNKVEDNTLPVKETDIEIDVPVIKDVKPSKITVVANTTEGTNGESVGEVKFGKENWEYNEEENKLKISVSNEKQLVEINESEGEYLQEGDKVEEERFYNGSGIDEYLVTYTYGNVSVSEDESIEVNTKASVTMMKMSGSENGIDNNVAFAEKDNSYKLTGTTGEIVSLNIENNKKEISKAYAYVNYNNADRYEVETTNEILVNVSYKDIVEGIIVKDEENTYVDKAGNALANNDIYYKKISISKENFDNILGENGEIKVKDEAENIINVINKDSVVNEDGNIEVGFGEKYSRLSFETTKPIAEGNIVISTVKGTTNASIDKATYINLDKISTRTKIEAKYNYVDELVNVGEVQTEQKLTDTTTEANLVIDRNSFSTLESNKDVEMRIELNNARENSDIYGHSEFEIELPENIESVELTNASLLYGEGLEISSSSVEGRIIRVTLDGKQEGINSGVLTNGTNIVLNANINVNMYTPAKKDIIRLRYTNSEATNYVDNGVKEVEIEYSAPTGLVAVNSISNYDAQGSVVTSIRQGRKEGVLPIYSNAITARTELIIMNNNKNAVGNISILGRIPFKGIKDLKSGEELGTTIDSKLVGNIEVNSLNRGSFIIYYSENGDATRDLNDQNNAWTTEPVNIENIKSYLIVPAEENYEMSENEILRFSYNYNIPENLAHNENSYGTFGVYYTNNSEVSEINELEVADLVGLSTGAGPELEVSIENSKQEVKEKEEFPVNISISNVGKNIAENLNIEFPIPEGSTYSRYDIDIENANITEEEGRLVVSLEKMEIGQNIQLKVYLIAKSLLNVKVEWFEDTSKITESEDTDSLITSITPTVNVTAKDLGAVITKSSSPIDIKAADFYITETNNSYYDIEEAGNEIPIEIAVRNMSSDIKDNVIITKVLPNEFSFVNATENYTYDENTRTVTWNIGTLDILEKKAVKLYIKVNELEENIGKKEVEISCKAKADNTEEYESSKLIITIGKPILVISQTTSNQNTYVKEGDEVNYIFNIKNEGGATAKNVVLKDNIPEGIAVSDVYYIYNGNEMHKTIFDNTISIETSIKPGEEWVLNMVGSVGFIGTVSEKSATNYAVISSRQTQEATSNSITHIIESSGENNSNVDEESSNGEEMRLSTSTRTYRISGIAWLDENQDGMRNSGEELLSSIPVKLVDSESGVVEDSITTDSNGNYTFTGVSNGNYLVLFEYDTITYKVTTYQKEGIATNVNSDAISTTIQKDGKATEGAVTDVISVNGGSVSNIDLGLILANVFDLKLDKYISKVMVQTSKDTQTENYNNVKLAKTDIGAKYLSGATVFVEYTIIVSNAGDLAGYAKKIVDYIPEGMAFNSTLDANKDWYTGSDGNLYSEILANKELKSGETATIKLILTRQMTEENTGLVNNVAEIYEDYNTYGVKDINSKVANKAQGENDMSSADISILVRTGETLIYISIIITSILLGSIVIFITQNKIVAKKRKGGV